MSDSPAQARAKLLAIREKRHRAAIKKLSDKMIERKGVAQHRAEIIYELLKALDMPMTAKEISQLVGLPLYQVSGSGQPLELLVAEGKIARSPVPGSKYGYYADPDLGPSLTEHAPFKEI